MDAKEVYKLVDGIFAKTGFTLLYLVIALAVCIVAVGVLVYIFKRDKFSAFVKYAVGITAGVALCALTLLTYLKWEAIKLNPNVDMNTYGLVFYPVLTELIIAVAGMIAILVCSLFNKKASKIAGIATAVLLLGGFIAIMVELTKYFNLVSDYYENFNLAGLAVSAVVFMVLIAVIYFIGDKRIISDTRSIVYGAISIAMSFALSYIKLFEMPQGGSLTLASLLPLMIYCCMFGTRRGTIVCLIYGVLQAVQDPWIIHPMQFLLDYPLAFGMIGISGIFIEKGVFKGNKQVIGFALGAIIAVTGRYICHVLSGVFAFAEYSNVSSAFVYSLTYNSFAFIDLAIALGAGIVLFLSKAFVSQMTKSSDLGKKETETPVSEVNLSQDEDDGFVYLDDIKASREQDVKDSNDKDSNDKDGDDKSSGEGNKTDNANGEIDKNNTYSDDV